MPRTLLAFIVIVSSIPDSPRIVPRINGLGWKVQRMLPTHGVPASIEELNRSLEIRANSVKGADTRHRLR